MNIEVLEVKTAGTVLWPDLLYVSVLLVDVLLMVYIKPLSGL